MDFFAALKGARRSFPQSVKPVSQDVLPGLLFFALQGNRVSCYECRGVEKSCVSRIVSYSHTFPCIFVTAYFGFVLLFSYFRYFGVGRNIRD